MQQCLSWGAQDATYYSPSAWSFRDSYYLFVGDTWNVPADDAAHISWVKGASAAMRPYYVGNYINRASLPRIAPLSGFLCKPASKSGLTVLTAILPASYLIIYNLKCWMSSNGQSGPQVPKVCEPWRMCLVLFCQCPLYFSRGLLLPSLLIVWNGVQNAELMLEVADDASRSSPRRPTSPASWSGR